MVTAGTVTGLTAHPGVTLSNRRRLAPLHGRRSPNDRTDGGVRAWCIRPHRQDADPHHVHAPSQRSGQSCVTTGWRRRRGDRVMECRRRPKDLDVDGQPDEWALCSCHRSDDNEHQSQTPEGRSKHDESTLERARGSRPPRMRIDQPMTPRAATPARYEPSSGQSHDPVSPRAMATTSPAKQGPPRASGDRGADHRRRDPTNDPRG
jgi:hypothetical protein